MNTSLMRIGEGRECPTQGDDRRDQGDSSKGTRPGLTFDADTPNEQLSDRRI
jgi:hypothetical protein